MTYVVSSIGMKKGYWKIENMKSPGFSVTTLSGIRSKAAAEHIARDLNKQEDERYSSAIQKARIDGYLRRL